MSCKYNGDAFIFICFSLDTNGCSLWTDSGRMLLQWQFFAS